MTQLVFLLKEPSAQVLLDNVLPRLLPPEVTFRCIPHEGKQDLEKSIPIKLRHWNIPNSWFVVVRDKDQDDCERLKARLQLLCEENHRPETLVRIAVHELESWFLGDLTAVGVAFNKPRLAEKQKGRKFRNPDALANAQEELKKLITGYQKVAGARAIAPHLDLANNRSVSFQQFVTGVHAYLEHIDTL